MSADQNWQIQFTPFGITLAQDGAQACIELTEDVLEASGAALSDPDVPAADDAAYRAAQLTLLSAIAYSLIDLAAAVRELKR